MCLDEQILNTYLDGELAEPWKSQVEEHLSYCSSCRTRCQKLLELKNTLSSSTITEEEIAPHKDRVMSMIEKNYLSRKSKKESFIKRQFRVTAPQLMGVAAAFVVVFVGSWAIFGGNGNDNTIPMPELNSTIDINNITQVRASENSTTSKTLENYSLDEILKNLDARGYDVDIRMKSIQPVSFEKLGTEGITVTLENGVIIRPDGKAYNKENVIVATGVKVNKDGVVLASDGTVLFEGIKIVSIQ